MKLLSHYLVSEKNYETALSQQAMELCERLQEEMGADLHDDLIQKLSVFQLLIDRLERSAREPAEVEDICSKMRVEFQSVVHAVRRISRQWMPVHMESSSFTERLQTLCQNMEHPGASHIHFEVAGAGEVTDERKVRYLQRIVQELVHNALRHSTAWHIWVRLHWQPKSLLIEVEDDGTGVTRLKEFIDRLQAKHNTLRMRADVISARLSYEQGKSGLLARVECLL